MNKSSDVHLGILGRIYRTPIPVSSLSFRFRVDDIVGSDSYEIINEDILGNGGMLSQQL